MPDIITLEIKNLQVGFPIQQQTVKVVRGVDLQLAKGKTLGLVGESGSGKSMTAQAILGLVPYPGRVSGSIQYHGQELAGLSEAGYEKIRGRAISMVFQDPAQSLNPVLTIEAQLLETLCQHQAAAKNDARKKIIDLLDQVGIPTPEKRLRNFPHELSGGMKQRVLIGMALICEPDVLILDEPTTALDVTVQAQILDLVERIQEQRHMSILLISHDLGMVAEIADSIAVMYAGLIIEYGTTELLLNTPWHPYTHGLLNSIPRMQRHKQRLNTIGGYPPDPQQIPAGCPFHPRCYQRIDRCSQATPALVCNQGHAVACWNPDVTHG